MTLTVTTAIRRIGHRRQFVVTLPNGSELTAQTRIEAERAYVCAVSPDLAQRASSLAASLPYLSERVHRAALIVLAGGVQPTPGRFYINHHGIQVDTLAIVRSQTREDGVYEVFSSRGQLACNCPDAHPQATWEHSAPASKFAQHTCKHILAVLLSA